jgi:hypothetical protein
VKVFDSIVTEAEIACVLQRMRAKPFTLSDLRQAADDAGVVYTYEFCCRLINKHRSELRPVTGRNIRPRTWEWVGEATKHERELPRWHAP